MNEENLTAEEVAELQQFVGGGKFPTPEEKVGIYSFLNKVLISRESSDMSKSSNLDNTELFSVRTYLEGATFADIEGANIVANYLRSMAKVQLSTSLSKKGFLVDAAITTKREIGTKKTQKKKSTWFNKNVEDRQ